MKKILTVLITLIIIISLTGCSNTETNKETPITEVSQKPSVSPRYVPSPTPTAFSTNSAGEQNKKQTDTTKEVTTEKKMNTMNITIGSTTFTATLEANNTTKAFMAQLPLTVNMSELNGNEKFSNISGNLRADMSSCPETINLGDIMLYGNNCIVLFYKTFNTSYSYVKLGHIADPTGLAKAVGSGSVQVTFSIGK